MRYNPEQVHGVLKLSESEKNYRLSRIFPSDDLACYIEQYWIVSWDLRNRKPHLQENIPHPCVHLVLEQNKSRIVGAVTRKYSYRLSGAGKIFGVKFRPGGFCPFVNRPVSGFTDSQLPVGEVFGVNNETFINDILSCHEDTAMVAIAEDFLRSRMPLHLDKNIEKVNHIIETISSSRWITRVEQLVSSLKIEKWMLQRLFNTYVGVSPKWVIRKYRIHEILERMEQGDLDWHQLITDLGYFDQAHFIRDFKEFVGKPPTEYLGK